ncbi:MAG: hypothetical protein K5755_01280 [Clostridiales bacterium]|nr:hypothetical protein [Clostridiales bacterium]
MRCRKLDSCEINSIIANSERAKVTVALCCRNMSREMCASAVKINGSYRLTLEGELCAQMLNALSASDAVTVKYTGSNCCGTYCVTASGVPDSVTVCGCNRVKFTLTDFITDGVLKY